MLNAALHLTANRPLGELSIEAIAKHSAVSRPTIYRWWNNKGEIIMEALLEATKNSASYDDTGNVTADLTAHSIKYCNLLSGPIGEVYRAVFAEALINPLFREQVRQCLIEPRREETRRVLKSAIELGQIAIGTDIEALIDSLYAPFIYRLMIGHGPLTIAFANTVITQVLDGVVNRQAIQGE